MREEDSPPQTTTATQETLRAPAWVWTIGISPGAWRVLIGLWSYADHASSGEAVVFPSRPRLARRLGVTARTVRSKIAILRSEGWLRYEVEHSYRDLAVRLAWKEPRSDWAEAAKRTEPSEKRKVPAAEGLGIEAEGLGIEAEGSVRPRSGRFGSSKRKVRVTEAEGSDTQIDQRPIKDQLDQLTSGQDQKRPEAGGSDQPPSKDQQFALDIQEPETPKADQAAEVFEHLRARIIATKRDIGIKPATAPKALTKQRRAWIDSRIEEHGGGAEGVEACKRVIAIDEWECRSQGPKGDGWNYWNADTPFRNARNFESRLGRWRENGDHQAFGSGNGGKGMRMKVAGYGATETHRKLRAANDPTVVIVPPERAQEMLDAQARGEIPL